MGSNESFIICNKKKHIVMAPFMAQGHLIPFLALANQIHKRTGFTITIATTPLNVQCLHKAMSPSSDISLAALPFSSSDHGLPPNTENTEGLTLEQFGRLLLASLTLKPAFHSLIEKITLEDGVPPFCIISDTFLGWTNEVAKLCDTVNITFTTGGAYGTAAYMSLRQNLPHRKLESGEDEFNMDGFPESIKFKASALPQYIRAADGTDDFSKFFQSQLRLSRESDGWLCNTAEDIEKCGLEILRNYLKLPVWPIGPLLPESMLKPRVSLGSEKLTARAGKEYGISPNVCISWLDTKQENSVLFITFGSQNSIKPAQMMAMATGLELSGVSFIWVIRPPIGSDIKGVFQPEWLPDGFENRVTMSNKGLLVHQWAPQLEILAHKSTGAFLSHCGWNSVLEALCQGVPIIGWPLAAEQPYNSKMLVEEMQVAVEICKGLDEVLTVDRVKGVVEKVMKSEVGVSLRQNAAKIGAKMKASMRDDEGYEGPSIKALDDCIAHVMSVSVTRA